MLRRKALAVTSLVFALTVGLALPAQALPDETTWSESGLREMVRVTGHLSWSVDGLGTASGDGTLQVEKPAEATVIAAYFMAAQTGAPSELPSGISLNGSEITFTHRSTGAYTNLLADVTSVVAPTVDGAPAGIVDLAVDEGTTDTEGTALLVIFEDPSVDVASVLLYFGNSNSVGDAFSLDFPALTTPQLEDLRMSAGSSFSYGSGQNSSVTVNGQILSEQLGHFDDCDEFVRGEEAVWTCDNGALLTVGGVGDSLDNPVQPTEAWTTSNDDELYSLSPFVEVGDTTIEVTSLNPSGDDNLFMAAFYLKEVRLDGSEPVGEAITEPSPSPTPAAAPELAATGVEFSAAGGSLLALLIAAGLVMLALARRRRA